MLMNIWVRDNLSGYIHQIGTDLHDRLELVDGVIEYYNLQNGCGTRSDADGYSFVEAPTDSLDDYVTVTPDILRVNREYLHRDVLKMLEEHPEIFEEDEEDKEESNA